MLECLVGVAVCSVAGTASLCYLLRRHLIQLSGRQKGSYLIPTHFLKEELSQRGFDYEQEALQSYIDKNFVKVHKLGEGASGIVHCVKSKKTGEKFALKRIQKQKGRRNTKDPLEVEIACLRKLKHQCIVNIVEAVDSPSVLWILMEVADGGGLYERILKVTHFSELSAAKVVKQVLTAVHYMHSYGIVHRDLKAENVLLTSADMKRSDIKVADFGLAVDFGLPRYDPRESRNAKSCRKIREGYCGSPICMAPEVAQRHAAYGPQCDVWSVGCMAHELLSGEPPFTARTPQDLFKIIAKSNGPTFEKKNWRQVSEEAKDLVRNMLVNDPVERKSAREALHFKWFQMAPDVHNEHVHYMLTQTAMATCGITETASPKGSDIKRDITRAAMHGSESLDGESDD